MSPEQIQGLKQLFHTIDADNSGTITVDELKTALHDMGNHVTVAPPPPFLRPLPRFRPSSLLTS